jgi:hypothetical protein
MDKRKEILIKALKDKEAEISYVAAEALEKIRAREKIGHLADKLTSGEMLEKIRAVYALTGLKGQAVIDLVVKALKDPSPDVRAAAARALGEMGDLRALKPLVEALDDEDPVVLRSIVDALIEYKDPRLLGPMTKLLKNKDAGVVERALEVIAAIGDKRSEEAMLYFADKGNKKMKAAAMKALGAMES